MDAMHDEDEWFKYKKIFIDKTIRERYQEKWICGLCAEVVKDEMMRCERLINAEEALTRHLHLYKKLSSSTPHPDPTIHLITAMRQLLRRSYGDRILIFCGLYAKIYFKN
uniref:Uncharacterized protein n=1 Tax=Solanum lycopersicum TaxID=4081 RepID=A0A3Q7EUX6_SOLLC